MCEELSGFRYWQLEFDAHGQPTGPGADELVADLSGDGLKALFVFSHGWNNNAEKARALYQRFFEQVGAVLPGSDRTDLGLAGVIWPSMRWPDEEPPGTPGVGGAASLAVQADPDLEAIAQLRAVYPEGEQRSALDEAAGLLATEPADREAIERFHSLLRVLAGPDEPIDAPEDHGERALLTADAQELLSSAAELDDQARSEGAVGLGDEFGRLWAGARGALRQVTYWQMKKRAGVVGVSGLAPLMVALHEASSTLRIHLIGHSFGARLVSFSLRGLSEAMVGDA
jgi:hypothetical protein